MNFSEHAKAGGLVAAAVTIGLGLYLDDFKTPFQAGLLAFSGSLFPDLDIDSIPSRYTARACFCFSIALMWLDNPWPPAIAGTLFFLVKSGKHRGFTHKYSLPLICGLLAAFYGNWLFAAFGVGLLTHYALDRLYFFDWGNWK
jgi:hypothetical protein